METTRETEGRVRLRLAVCRAEGADEEFELEARASLTVGDAATALAHELGAPAVETLTLARTGDELPADLPLLEAGLRDGDEVLLGGVRESLPPAPAELRVEGGPDAGRRIPLARGAHVVGRGAPADVLIDDAALSGEHLRVEVGADGSASVEDLGSRNGTAVDGVSLDEGPVPLARGAFVAAGRTLLRVAPAAPEPAPPPGGRDGTIPFNRPPRVIRPREEAVRPFPAPPQDPQRARLPFGASLLPLGLGIGLWLVTGIPTMLLFAALSPLMAISTYIEDRRSGRKGFQRRSREYHALLAEVRDELEAERHAELRRRHEAAPSAVELLRRARTLDQQLWERRTGDPDFLELRLGVGTGPALLRLQVDRGGNEELRREAESLGEWYSTIGPVPVTAPLAEARAVGLCGAADRVESLGSWLVAQAAALHSPRELAIGAAIAPERLEAWDWLKWLPHTAADGHPLSTPLAAGPDAARRLLEETRELVRGRRAEAETTYGSARRATPALLLVLDEALAPERALVAETLAGAADAAVVAVWLGSDRRDLPGECGAIVELEPGIARLGFTDAAAGTTAADVSADGLASGLPRALARSLAPLRDAGAGAQAAGIPSRIGFADLLGRTELDADWVETRWSTRDGTALAAVVGSGAAGPIAVDLRADGPHGLVAGTTGAGKSELLQTLIASLAISHPPDRLTFLLVDYKGGAAFKDCVALPHTVGLVTDLDGHLAERALRSLNAELRRRERLLRDAGAKDLHDLEHRDPSAAPPSLLIVVDEFATLAREVPEFIDGVVDVAQRGRSLGVHLLLATQRPSGVVSDNIRANTNLRIALRVAEAAESTDVVGVPDAARISRDRPGRAYVRTGHGEVAELQTAFVGGPVVASQPSAPRIAVRPLTFETARAADRRAAGGETELSSLVAACAKAATRIGAERPRAPWLPPLEPIVPLASLDREEERDPSAVATLGVLDEPGEQRQQPWTVDLEAEGSLLVYGASGSGKTALLRTLAVSLAERASPAELHLYGLDFATRGLLALEALPHCGSVIGGDDEERTARLFARLRAELERRKLLLARRGVFSLSEYGASGDAEPLPRILVLLDGYAGFAAAFERVNLGELVDALPRLVGDGRPLGLHFAITADRRAALPNALAAIVPAKVVLRMADDDELAALGIPLKTVRGMQMPPGRGFLPGGTELQVALPGDDPSGEGQAAAVAEAAAEATARWPDRTAPAIEPMPTRVELASLGAPAGPLAASLGLGDAELAPVTVDLSERHLLVAGPYRSGRSTALATLAGSLSASTPGVELHLLAPRRSPLVDLPLWDSVAAGHEECDRRASELAALVEERNGEGPPLVVVVDDADELAESAAALPLETVVRRGRDRNARVLAAAERVAAQRAFSGWLRELRKDEHGLLLSPDTETDGELLGVRLPRRTNPVYPPGRGYLVERGTVELVQVAV